MPARAAQSDVCVKPHTMNVNPAIIANISGISSCPVRGGGGGGGTEQGGLLEWGVAEAGTRGRQAQRETAHYNGSQGHDAQPTFGAVGKGSGHCDGGEKAHRGPV